MKYCSHCGHPNQEDALFCGSCGRPLNQKNEKESAKGQCNNTTTSKNGGSWIDSLNEYVGNDRPADLNWRVLFTDVFKPHTTEEAEEIFICGTKATTPNMCSISKDWPRPWLYSRVLLMFVVTFALLWICVNAFGNLNAFPGMIVIGSFAVPLSTMVLFMEANVWRNVSMYTVIRTFFVGGCASLVATLLLFSFYTVEEMDFLGAFMVGLIEELGKAIIVLTVLRKLGKLSIMTGLLIGACVGAGFAAFESAGYALQPFVQFQQISGYAAAYGQNIDSQQMMDAINNTIFLRAVLAPGGHVAWAAISGAAFVTAAKEKGIIDASLFTESKFLRLFFIPVILHCLWDSPLAGWINGGFPYAGYIALIFVVWTVVLILINMGLGLLTKVGKFKISQMKECPQCHTRYDDSMNFCTKDGCQLVAINKMATNLVSSQQNSASPKNKSNRFSTNIVTSQRNNKKGGCLKKIVIAVVVLIIALVVFYNYIMNAATYLRVEPNQIGFVKAGGECKVEIDYDGYVWLINHKPDWVDIDENENDFTIKVTPNQTGNSREGSITIQSGKQLAQVIIKQLEYATQMRVSENTLKFSSSGGGKAVTVETDGCGWEVESPDWITVKNDDDDVVISCQSNTDEYRTGSVTFKEDNVSATVYITQGGKCNNCHGNGEVSCSYCWGQGGSNFGFYYSQCTWCGGSGKLKCSTCNGTGEREE